MLLTAFTTVIGLIPLTFGINIDFVGLMVDLDPSFSIGSENTQFWGPMGTAIISGLTFATFLTLVIVPVMYSAFDSLALRVAAARQPDDVPEPTPHTSTPLAGDGSADGELVPAPGTVTYWNSTNAAWALPFRADALLVYRHMLSGNRGACEAGFDGRPMLVEQAWLNMALTSIVILELLMATYVLMRDCKELVSAPVRSLVKHHRKMDALLTVFKALHSDDDDASTDDTCDVEATGGDAPCVFTPVDCDDGNVCTDDARDPVQRCTFTANTDSCDDGNPCTENDRCAQNICTGGGAKDCDDSNVCTNDSCDKDVSGGCVNDNNTLSCMHPSGVHPSGEYAPDRCCAPFRGARGVSSGGAQPVGAPVKLGKPAGKGFRPPDY